MSGSWKTQSLPKIWRMPRITRRAKLSGSSPTMNKQPCYSIRSLRSLKRGMLMSIGKQPLYFISQVMPSYKMNARNDIMDNLHTDGQRLHDRATRGEPLSDQERALLDQWYAAQDQAEHAVLQPGGTRVPAAALQQHVDAALARLRDVAEQIQVLSDENAATRREIASLQRQLAQRSTSHAA